jgi:hypothetical protein
MSLLTHLCSLMIIFVAMHEEDQKCPVETKMVASGGGTWPEK